MIIELTTGLLTLYSAYISQGSTSAQSTSAVVNDSFLDSADEHVIKSPINGEALAKYVKEYFRDTPLLIEIAKCESTMRHETLTGEIIRGEVNPNDVGLMQINEYYHKKRATTLGFDIQTLDGNMSYAKYLYGKEGAKPWASSSKCWKKTDTYKKLAANK